MTRRRPLLPPLRFLSPLHRATRRIAAALRPRTAELGIEPAQAHVVAYLLSYGPCPVAELQRVFGHPPSTLTSLLDRLEHAKLAERAENPDDRRSVLVGLTALGERVGAGVRRATEELEAAIAAATTEEDIEGFQAVIAAIEAATREPRTDDGKNDDRRST